jgi:hypothetical protein
LLYFVVTPVLMRAQQEGDLEPLLTTGRATEQHRSHPHVRISASPGTGYGSTSSAATTPGPSTTAGQLRLLHADESAKPASTGIFRVLSLGLHRPESRRTVLKLAALFVIDSFAGGFVLQSVMVYWFQARYGSTQATPQLLGTVLLASNAFAGVSALVSASLVKRFGAIRTMFFTNLPANALLLLVPFMPSMWWVIALLLLRCTVSQVTAFVARFVSLVCRWLQMDVPARQTFVALTVAPDERTAAGGITSIVRSVGRPGLA